MCCSGDVHVPPSKHYFNYNRSNASDEHVGQMSDSSGGEEATVCPDDQSIDVAIDDLTLDTGGGGKTAVPTVSPVDAQPPDKDDLSNRIPGVEDVLHCVRLSHHIKQLLHNSTYFKDVKKQDEIFEGVEYKQLWVELALHLVEAIRKCTPKSGQIQ